jgi:hypothetical protein
MSSTGRVGQQMGIGERWRTGHKGDYADLIDRARVKVLTTAILAAGGNRRKAARALGITSNWMSRLSKQMGIPNDLGRDPNGPNLGGYRARRDIIARGIFSITGESAFRL